MRHARCFELPNSKGNNKAPSFPWAVWYQYDPLESYANQLFREILFMTEFNRTIDVIYGTLLRLLDVAQVLAIVAALYLFLHFF